MFFKTIKTLPFTLFVKYCFISYLFSKVTMIETTVAGRANYVNDLTLSHICS